MYKNLSKVSILYVEDEDNTREIFSKILKKFSKEVIVAKDGEEGLEKFKKFSADLIITDINMPKINGIELIKQIREKNQEIPIVIVTAFSDFNHAYEAIKLNVDYFFLKPISDIEHYLSILDKIARNYLLKKEHDKKEKIIKTILDSLYDISFYTENDKIILINNNLNLNFPDSFKELQQKIPSLKKEEKEELIKIEDMFFYKKSLQVTTNIYLFTFTLLMKRNNNSNS
jgi:YesN/AraC family two-component response regulator